MACDISPVRCFIPRNNLDLEVWGKLSSNGIEFDAEDLIADGFSICLIVQLIAARLH